MKTIDIEDLDVQEKDRLTSATAARQSGLVILLIDEMQFSKRETLTNETALNGLLIDQKDGICQGKPIIRGTRIAVHNIVEFSVALDWSIQKILDEYPQLTKEQIIAALNYYEEHQKEIDSYLAEEQEIDV